MEGLSLVASNIREDGAPITSQTTKHSVAPNSRPDAIEGDEAVIHDTETHPSSWVCVFGSFLFLIPSYGFPQAMGTVQSYLHENQLSEYAIRDLGWITGTFTALTLFLGLQAGPIVDRYSPKVVAPVASALTVPMYILLAECTEYWHFMLCLGVFGGIGGAMTSTLALSVAGKLFTRFRGLAIGMALTGSALGGVIFPFMLRQLLPTLGYAWTMRTLGAVIAGAMIPGCVCFIPFNRMYRLHQLSLARTVSSEGSQTAADETMNEKKATSAAINLTAFLSPAFSAIAATFFVLEFVIFGISGILPAFSNMAGNPAEVGYYLIAILNGAGLVGRIVSGFLGDRFGHCNVLFIATVVTAGITAATLVPFGTTEVKALYAFAAVWGISSGFFSALVPACVGKTCDSKDYGRYCGTLNFTVSFSLLITVPIGGEMLESLGGTALAGLYVGVLCLAAGTIFLARYFLTGSVSEWRTRI